MSISGYPKSALEASRLGLSVGIRVRYPRAYSPYLPDSIGVSAWSRRPYLGIGLASCIPSGLHGPMFGPLLAQLPAGIVKEACLGSSYKVRLGFERLWGPLRAHLGLRFMRAALSGLCQKRQFCLELARIWA